MRFILATFLLPALLCSCVDDHPEPPVSAASSQYIERGRYLTKSLAACGACHGETNSPTALLSGGRFQFDKYGEVQAPNLTQHQTGLRGWSTIDLMRALRAGRNVKLEQLSPEVHHGYEWMADEDALAIASYIFSLPAVENEVERREVGFISRNTKGLLDRTREVKGLVPVLDSKNPRVYGKYLVDHVARCSSCHNSSGGLLSAEEYLAGGKLITNDAGEKLAPNITTSQVYGIGNWSEGDIIKYLRTGINPSGDEIDPNFCPVQFYTLASNQDLSAIAQYLKTVQ